MKQNIYETPLKAHGQLAKNTENSVLKLLTARCQVSSAKGSNENTIADIGTVQKKPDLVSNNQSCAMVVLFVSEYLDIPVKQLLWPTRSNAATAQARQIAIYIVHTMLSISYTDAARYFERDRTTISHACHLVEDLRDDKLFDGKLERLEKLLAIAIRFSGTESNGKNQENPNAEQMQLRCGS